MTETLFLGSSDKDQLTYTQTRFQDLQEIQGPVGGYTVRLRVFTVDNPARQANKKGGTITVYAEYTFLTIRTWFAVTGLILCL